jgi:hypothetical protein
MEKTNGSKGELAQRKERKFVGLKYSNSVE